MDCEARICQSFWYVVRGAVSEEALAEHLQHSVSGDHPKHTEVLNQTIVHRVGVSFL